MSQNDISINVSDIYEELTKRNFHVNVIEQCRQNDRIAVYRIDKKYILRISDSIQDELGKLEQVQSIMLTPKIHSTGKIISSGKEYEYLIADYMEGSDLFGVLKELTEEQSLLLGKDIARFLMNLHSMTDASYDIGHYIPTVPRYRGSWKEGHLEYIKMLRNSLSALHTGENSITSAFDFINENIDCLEYQAGAKLLHNDFHPKNIIVKDGRLAGVIDWECSQYGEADFELAHLFHWCVYPPEQGGQFELLLKSLIKTLGIVGEVPNLAKRLTIYQLEHELNQLVWNGRQQEEERMQRINGWLNGQIEALLKKWQLG
jgi:aminoglycoside phosphotransferase (APT) family kinase protein